MKRSWTFGFLRFLHHVANDGRHLDELTNVERFRAIDVIIRPIPSNGEKLGYWACDGELIEAKEVRIRAHRRALNLFATGVRLEEIKKINGENVGLIDRIFDY